LNIKELTSQLHLSQSEKDLLEHILHQAFTDQVTVGVFGSFSVGKSELLNNLLERKNLLPTHTNETTAIVTRIVYGEEDKGELVYTDEQVDRISMDELQQFVAGGSIENVEKIKITLSNPEWLKQIEFIDTPGRNTKFQAHIEASQQAIMEADAAIYVLPWQGVTIEDIVYLKELLLFQPNLYFVLNKVDRIEEAQGQTIEEVRQKVEDEISTQLGGHFPVYALSAKTGYNLDDFKQEFIPKIINNIQTIKEKRFKHALKQLLLRYERNLLNEINIYKLVKNKDKVLLEDEMRTIEVEQIKLQDRVDRELSVIKDLLSSAQSQVGNTIESTIGQSKKQLSIVLKEMAEKKGKEHALQQVIENQLVGIRNTVYKNFEDKINQVTANPKLYQLSGIAHTESKIQYQEPTFEELQVRYAERLQQITNNYEVKKNKLISLLEADATVESGEEIESLKMAIEEIEGQLLEEYVPQYLKDENFNEEKYTKILGYVGKAGDIAASIGLAFLTAGVSAGAQVAAKAGGEVAKETGKQAVKIATKETFKRTGKVIAKGAIKEVSKEAAKQSGKELAKQYGINTLKALGQLASPVETLTTTIGKAIDQSRSADEVLDQRHRQQFFIKKQKIDEKYESLRSDLEKLKQAQQNNHTVAKSIELKRLDLEKRQEEEMKQLELVIKRDQERLCSMHFEEYMNQQLNELFIQEKGKYLKWVEVEVNQIYHMLSKTIPSYYEEETTKWLNQIRMVKEGFLEKEEDLNGKLNELHSQITLCNEIREQLHDGA
jgi:hypothetical protein